MNINRIRHFDSVHETRVIASATSAIFFGDEAMKCGAMREMKENWPRLRRQLERLRRRA